MIEKNLSPERQNGLTVREALAYLEKQLTNGKYAAVIDGCQDILAVDPRNQKALKLLTKAEKKTRTPHQSIFTPKIIAIGCMIVIVSGIAIWQLTKEKTPVITHDRTTNQDTENSKEANERKIRNQQRLADLTELENAVKEAYKRDHTYPVAATLEETLTNGGFIEKIPEDPRAGEKDVNGTIFHYMYAVYDNVKGDRQEYILSGIFEENTGENIVWTLGGNTTDHTDYRDDSLPNVAVVE